MEIHDKLHKTITNIKLLKSHPELPTEFVELLNEIENKYLSEENKKKGKKIVIFMEICLKEIII